MDDSGRTHAAHDGDEKADRHQRADLDRHRPEGVPGDLAAGLRKQRGGELDEQRAGQSKKHKVEADQQKPRPPPISHASARGSVDLDVLLLGELPPPLDSRID